MSARLAAILCLLVTPAQAEGPASSPQSAASLGWEGDWFGYVRAGYEHVTDDEDFGSPLSRQRFCIHYWLAAEAGTYDGLLTARVRVVWPVSTLDRSGLDEVCAPDGANAFQEDVSRWYTLTVPASIRSGDG